MESQAYLVALVTRGAGAYGYSYLGPPGLQRGRLCAVPFRGRIETGVVAGPDAAPQGRLLPLWPLDCPAAPALGTLLCDLAELACCGADEIAGHLLFAGPAAALRLRLALPAPQALPQEIVPQLGALAGHLAPRQLKELAASGLFNQAAEAAWQGAAQLTLELAGFGGGGRPAPWQRRWYALERRTAQLLGLGHPLPHALPGSYLAGLTEPAEFSAWPVVEAPDRLELPAPPAPELAWEESRLNDGWEVARRFPGIARLAGRRAFATWALLRAPGGLPAELAQAAAEGQRVLLVTPQAWLLDRLWPLLSPLATRLQRFRPEYPPSQAAQLVRQAGARPGQIIAGGPGAWKLAAYLDFDRVILLDPSHPQYAPERYPGLDPRAALLVLMAGRAVPPALDLIELGLSAADGRSSAAKLYLLEPYEPPPGEPRPGGRADTNPLPLPLRQPGTRRLIYFNRLGSGRGLRCMECQAAVACPSCGSPRIHYSPELRGYRCPQCGFESRELRCPSCGLASLAAQLPGLEAVTRRKGDRIIYGPLAGGRAHPEYQSVLGTSHLLEPVSGFWPEEIVYVHADAQLAVLEDWPRALDMALRLTALYGNPALRRTCIVSARLAGQLGAELTPEATAAQWELEDRLRRLAGLPPYGCIYKLTLHGGSRRLLAAGREVLGKHLQGDPQTRLLRIGRPFEDGRGLKLAAYLVNPALSARALQELRWTLHALKLTLHILPLRGPWL